MRLAIDGADFDILDEGRGPALVLIHGFPLAKESWDLQAAQLARRARVIRFDLRGLGSTTPTPGPYLMEALAGDLVTVLDALNVERAVVAGHSLGGYVTFAFYRMFAERCAGLGFVCSRASADDAAQAEARYALATRAEAEGIGPVVDAFVPRFFAPEFFERSPEDVERIRAMCARTDPKGAAAMLRGMAARVASDDLFEEIEVPVAIVAGAQDVFFGLHEARAIANNVRDAELAVIDCGHFPQLEAPDALTASLDRLVTRAAAIT